MGWARERGRPGRSGFDRGLWKLLSLLADLLSFKAADLFNPVKVVLVHSYGPQNNEKVKELTNEVAVLPRKPSARQGC